MKVSDLIGALKNVPGDATVNFYGDDGGEFCARGASYNPLLKVVLLVDVIEAGGAERVLWEDTEE